MAGTISPVEVYRDAPLDSHPSSFYYVLSFPDFQYCADKLRVVIGRSEEDDAALEQDDRPEMDFDDDEDDDASMGGRIRKRSFEAYEEDSHPASGAYTSKTKRMKTAASNEGDSDLSSAMEDVPQHTTRSHMTAVGGIGGLQTRSDNPAEDFLGVHPQVDEESGDMPVYTISKKHLLISWDDELGWKMNILGRNGAFLNDDLYQQGTELRLSSGDKIGLRRLEFQFHAVTAAEDNASDSDVEEADDSGEEMMGSVESDTTPTGDEDDIDDDEDSPLRVNVSEELAEAQGKPVSRKRKLQTHEGLDDHEEEKRQHGTAQPKTSKSSYKTPTKPPKTLKLKVSAGKGTGQGAMKGLGKGKGKEGKFPAPGVERPTSSEPAADSQAAVASVEAPQKKRGPGRPPADGIMSKRERKERERAEQAGISYGEPLPEKTKGRPRAGSKENANDAEVDATATGKKSKKLKRETSGANEGEDERNESKTPKHEATPEPPKPPSPKESDYPPEALMKPDDTYQSLLHTVLSESNEPLALPQIYEAIKNKWPHFRFSKATKGWESSVRHNLQSNVHFEKAGRAGKGYLWIVNRNVPFLPKSKKNEGASSGTASYQPHKSTMLPQQGIHQPVHGLGTNPYPYGQGYGGPSVQHLPYANGQRPQPIQNLQHHAQFTVPPNSLPHGQQQLPQQLMNGQRPPGPPHQNLPVHASQVQSSTNYSSPYAPNSASQPQAAQAMNNNMPVVPNRPYNVPSMPNGATPVRQSPYPQTSATSWASSTNGVQSSSTAPHQRLNSPASVGPRYARPGSHVVVEPPANEELRAGRIPAVVERFFTQLRRLSETDAGRTLKQAQLAVEWILKHPDSDEGLDREMQEFGVPKSMIDVIRKLIDTQSHSVMEQKAASQRGTMASNAVHTAGAAVRPPSTGPVQNAGSPAAQIPAVGQPVATQIRPPIPPPSYPVAGQGTAAPPVGVQPGGTTVVSGPSAQPQTTQSSAAVTVAGQQHVASSKPSPAIPDPQHQTPVAVSPTPQQAQAAVSAVPPASVVATSQQATPIPTNQASAAIAGAAEQPKGEQLMQK